MGKIDSIDIVLNSITGNRADFNSLRENRWLLQDIDHKCGSSIGREGMMNNSTPSYKM